MPGCFCDGTRHVWRPDYCPRIPERAPGEGVNVTTWRKGPDGAWEKVEDNRA